MPFSTNVFINCPFDKEYKPLLKAIYFTAVYLGLDPLLSENINAADSRMDGIKELIRISRFSIHDLSRIELTEKNPLSRFNMPFELGLDIGAKSYGGKKLGGKALLVLEEQEHRYKKALSDLAGRDIHAHAGKPEVAVRKVRNWYYNHANQPIDSAQKIWRLYNEFQGDFILMAQENELSQEDIDDMPWKEQKLFIRNWLQGRENFE